MAVKIPLVVGFTKSDEIRVDTCLKRLIPHLKKDQFAIVGGLAIRHHLFCAGIKYPKRPFNDLDIIVKSADTVLPSVINDFLVAHYHPQKGSSFYIVLIDTASKTKVDIFDYTQGPKELVRVAFHEYIVNMQSIEDQLVKTVLDTLKVVDKKVVDPKQFQDARLMMQAADMEEAQENWQSRNFKKYPSSLIKALEKAEEIVMKNPDLSKEKPYRKPKPYICPDCVSTQHFPLTSMRAIYKTLGYIE